MDSVCFAAADRAGRALRMTDGDRYDAIVVGSGFGGVFAAAPLVEAGARVLMLERGGWVERGPHNWDDESSMEMTPHFTHETSYRVVDGGQAPRAGLCACVGGQSVFYGGVSFRLREDDFVPKPDVVGTSGAAWPLRYRDLAPFYDDAERRLDVAGEAGADPVDPPRAVPYPQPPLALSETSRLVAAGGRMLGLKPFPLPLAIHHRRGHTRAPCVACPTCDTFACAVGAKNDLATTLLPELLAAGLELRARTAVVALVARNGHVSRVDGVDLERGRRVSYRAEHVVLAAGALATPHLLKSGGLEQRSPAEAWVGRGLMRHCNAIVLGAFASLPDGGRRFHKQVAFHDFYFGDGNGEGMLGSLQQLQTPPLALVRANAPWFARPVLGRAIPHLTGLLAMAEDEPRPENGLSLDPARRDALGLPELVIRHRYTRRDHRASRALCRHARRILRAAGALFFYTHDVRTFSHAAGTVRFGDDPGLAPLDRDCRFRGLENLFVTDASFMPTVGGVNPSLTIAANALRVGETIAGVRRTRSR